MQTKPQKTAVAILIPNKINFKTKMLLEKKKKFVMIKGSIHQEDTMISNVFILNKF